MTTDDRRAVANFARSLHAKTTSIGGRRSSWALRRLRWVEANELRDALGVLLYGTLASHVMECLNRPVKAMLEVRACSCFYQEGCAAGRCLILFDSMAGLGCDLMDRIESNGWWFDVVLRRVQRRFEGGESPNEEGGNTVEETPSTHSLWPPRPLWAACDGTMIR